MSDYIRFTERNGNGICIKETSTNDNKSIWNAIERLAELEDMIDDGRLWFTPSNGLRHNPFECAKRWEELWYEVRVQYNDLKDKIENGTLVELPCKVGDILYVPWQYGGQEGISFHKIYQIVIMENDVYVDFEVDTDIDYVFAYIYNFGKFNVAWLNKRFFLSKEKAEAEAKSRELKGE